ncbi:hypothetical protein AMTRI_Chr10g228480 [Amborella trichopoda]|uniref:ENTH domain-containing protein n=1 Tax=Amborella trichopoda TaxID=13333 RepID=W1NPK1_AMBTC|nr:ENTH domain-containing protein C794.11c-like [Amborella trichopoda]ERM96910.1 hypothetical protein AMTR_s00074p00106250 [Amborella trichopoda]|eukprot:XP_020517471.1 ENTH domain-containing protein C794.11c-like [Amborella trichopoda]
MTDFPFPLCGLGADFSLYYPSDTSLCFRRLVEIKKKGWRQSYKVLALLEYLITHGPRSVAQDFQEDRAAIQQIAHFQKRSTVKIKVERILQLRGKNYKLLEQERDQAREISRKITGFGNIMHTKRSDGSWGSKFPLFLHDCFGDRGDDYDEVDYYYISSRKEPTRTLPTTNQQKWLCWTPTRKL